MLSSAAVVFPDMVCCTISEKYLVGLFQHVIKFGLDTILQHIEKCGIGKGRSGLDTQYGEAHYSYTRCCALN